MTMDTGYKSRFNLTTLSLELMHSTASSIRSFISGSQCWGHA